MHTLTSKSLQAQKSVSVQLLLFSLNLQTWKDLQAGAEKQFSFLCTISPCISANSILMNTSTTAGDKHEQKEHHLILLRVAHQKWYNLLIISSEENKNLWLIFKGLCKIVPALVLVHRSGECSVKRSLKWWVVLRMWEPMGSHPTRLYQVEKRHMCTLPWKFPPQEMKEQLEPLSQMDSRLAAPPWGLPSSMELSLTIV